MTNKRIRKCGYARVSTLAEEQEHSLVAQTSVYKELIESDPTAEFAGIYADKKSGKDTRHRPQFTEMIRAAKRGEVDFIITKSIARFARSLVETLKTVRELRDIGVGIFFEKEGINTLDPKSDFMLSIYATVAESELTSMSDNVKWAARKRYKNGSVEIGRIYGYDLIDGQLIPNKVEAIVVKEIFARFLSGEGQERIANDLRERGAKCKLGGTGWRSSAIGRILRCEKYTGNAILQKTYKESFKKVKNNGEIPQYYVENNHEAIISQDDYDRAQERIAKSVAAHNAQKKHGLSPFSGKIKCGECGKGYLHRKNNRKSPYEKWIWSCQTYVHRGRKNCGGHNIRERDLQAAFLSAYNEAAQFKGQGAAVNLSESIADLLTQERELIALKVKGYLNREAYDSQHGDLVKQIKDTEAALLLETRRNGNARYDVAEEYADNLVASLEQATINGMTIIFKFKNGAEVTRPFNNDVDRKETWRLRAAKQLDVCNGEDSTATQPANEASKN